MSRGSSKAGAGSIRSIIGLYVRIYRQMAVAMRLRAWHWEAVIFRFSL